MKPSKAYICGKPNAIRYTDELVDEGTVDYRRRLISIMCDKDSSDEDIWDRILHEVLHTIDYEYALRLKETQIRILGSALSDVFWRNKWIKQ